MIHELKTWEEYFEPLASGEKNFELRKNDRGFQPGHQLLLREYSRHTHRYSGRTLHKKISYILGGPEAENFGLKPGYCILGLGDV